MPRPKPKSGQPVTLPPPRKIYWTTNDENALTDDLGLNIRNPTQKKRCEEMLEILAVEIGDYQWWEEHRRNYPSRASRGEEFKSTVPVLEKAFAQLDKLSHAALTDIKNAGQCWEEEETPRHVNTTIGPDRSVKKHDFIDAYNVRRVAQSALMELIVRMKRFSAQLTAEERRGRKVSPLPNLIERITKIFDEYYKGRKRDRDKNLKSFIKAASSRLTPLLRK